MTLFLKKVVSYDSGNVFVLSAEPLPQSERAAVKRTLCAQNALSCPITGCIGSDNFQIGKLIQLIIIQAKKPEISCAIVMYCTSAFREFEHLCRHVLQNC